MKPSTVVRLCKEIDKIHLITFTSAQHIYPDRVTNFVCNEADEVIEFDDNKLHYAFDMNDINMIILNPDKIKFNGLSIA